MINLGQLLNHDGTQVHNPTSNLAVRYKFNIYSERLENCNSNNRY